MQPLPLLRRRRVQWPVCLVQRRGHVCLLTAKLSTCLRRTVWAACSAVATASSRRTRASAGAASVRRNCLFNWALRVLHLTRFTAVRAGTVYRASVESCKTLRPGTLVALKIDGNVRGHAAAARDSLPSLQRDGRVPLASLRRGCVLREAHAYALLHEAPASAHIPAFCVPLVCDAVVAHRLKLPTSDCSVAYSTEPAYALALPLLGSSVHALSCETELSQQEVLALGAPPVRCRLRNAASHVPSNGFAFRHHR